MDRYQSGLIYQRAQNHMAHGAPSQLQLSSPWPIIIESGEGDQITDVDGNKYYDFHLGFTVGILGHNHPAMDGKLNGLVHSGSVTKEAIELSELVSTRYKKQYVQWTNSGTEATLLAIHIVRGLAVNGYVNAFDEEVVGDPNRQVIIKIEGGYHGVHDTVMVSTHPAINEMGSPLEPNPVDWGAGIQSQNTRVVPFNNLEALQAALAPGDVAGIILEPVMFNVGCILPKDDYLTKVRELCNEYGTLVIHDEVKTGLTVSHCGAGDLWPESNPDLIVLGKGIGGGLPVGAVLGHASIMNGVALGLAPHYSTFAGNPWTMKAGIVAMETITREAWERAAALADYMRRESQKLLNKYNVNAYVAGIGLKGTIVWNRTTPANDYREWELTLDKAKTVRYWEWMMDHNIFLSPGIDEQWTVSIQHSKAAADAYLQALDGFLVRETTINVDSQGEVNIR